MIEKVFLLGNPNVGKSVVFSRLTGVHVISSNYPGTTVEISKGYLKIGNEKIEVIDLPGTYSLEPTSKAEEVAVSLLKDFPKDKSVVINVIDSTNLERNLFLTLQLVEEGFSVIVCLNMCDDAKHRGVDIDVEKLKSLLGVPVVSTCAVTGVGIKSLKEEIKQARPNPKNKLTHEARWQEIGKIVETVQRLTHRHHSIRELLEDASVKPLSGLVISFVIVYVSFKAVRLLGELLINKIFDPLFLDAYKPVLECLSAALGQKGFIHHLLIGDLISGKIDFKQSLGVLTTAPYIEFAMVLPYVVSFYLILSLLEDIGYLPRLAVLLDNLLHRLGLHGYGIIPVLLGFGCNVPGILSTRVLESKRERFIASTLISIGVPCVPLQAMIFGLLGSFGGFYVAGVYLVLFVVSVIIGVILNRVLPGYSPELLIEIPSYRFPPMQILAKKLYFRIKGFLIEAVPVVLLGVIVINILLYFRLFDFVTDLTAPVIKGLFGLPKGAVIALIIGFLRKDVAVGMLAPLALSAKQLFIATTLLAISFPCIATFVVLLKELGLKYFTYAILVMIAVSIVVGSVLNFVILR
jgi:ferrous iron transport protein B